MSKKVRVPLMTTIYIDLPVDDVVEDLAIIEAINKLDEGSISRIDLTITQSDGTIHIDRADEWKVGDYKFINEEE